MKQASVHTLRMQPDVYYIWVGGSCDYGHEERASAGAYIMQQNNETDETYVISDDHTTEFRMILTVMVHAMEVLPPNSNIVFLTNVSYILQNFDREPDEKSANPDLISRCRSLKTRHQSVEVKLVPFHKYPTLPETHDLAHQAMLEHRRITMTYEEYLKQQQQAIDEEQSDDSCFLTEQPEGQFVRGH